MAKDEFPYYISEHSGEVCDENAGVLDEHEILAALRWHYDELERLRARHNGEVCVDVQEHCEKLEADYRALREKATLVEAELVTARGGGVTPAHAVDVLAREARANSVENLRAHTVTMDGEKWNVIVERCSGKTTDEIICVLRENLEKAYETAADECYKQAQALERNGESIVAQWAAQGCGLRIKALRALDAPAPATDREVSDGEG